MKTREAIERLQERKKIAIKLRPKDLRCDEVWPDEAEMSLNALKRDLPQDLYLEGDGYANGLPVYDTARTEESADVVQGPREAERHARSAEDVPPRGGSSHSTDRSTEKREGWRKRR